MLKDFSWWSSLMMADCKRGVEMLSGELQHREVGDRVFWFAADTEPPPTTKSLIDLVQVYDEVVVSYTVSRDALTETVRRDVAERIMFYWHPILMSGQVCGHWRRGSQGDRDWVELFLYRTPTRTKRNP